ncbi:MAG: DUF742 domain-containing protein [Asgard group archaeon]|nr:DUF742 domain-containing protein [Asgard group archaeon]
MRKLQIGVIGSKNLDLNKEQDKDAWDFSYKLGFALGRTLNIAVLLSGSSGISEAIAKGVNDSGGIAVNILAGDFKEVSTDESHVKIATTLDGFEHSWPLIHSCDCLIAIGGGAETGVQISLSVDLGIHVVIYSKAGGISSEVFTSLEPTFQKMRSSQLVYLVENAEEAHERAKQFALDRVKNELRVDEKTTIDMPDLLKAISNPKKLAILALLTTSKTQSSQEISNHLKIPLSLVQGYVEDLDSLELILVKKTIADEHLFSLNMDNTFTRKIVDIITYTLGDKSTE